MRSSLGFHTLTISHDLDRTDAEKLIEDFCHYRKQTGQIRIFQELATAPSTKKEYREFELRYNYDDVLLLIELYIQYRDVGKGIKWKFRAYYHQESFKEYGIEATINPKILGGIHDYITAATCDDMYSAIVKFNSIARSISPVLGTFEAYRLKRIDYCLNFALDEIAPGCTAKRMMNLIKRSNVPAPYKEWTQYDDTAHRAKSKDSSFYLICNSVNINCYSKYMKFQEQSQENIAKGFPPIPQSTMNAARDIIRFEVQCKYPKAYVLSKRAREKSCFAFDQYHDLFGYQTCLLQINRYYKATIGEGDWFTLSAAQRIIKKQKFNKQKEERLLNALREVNQCRSLAVAKEKHQGSDLDAFKRTLKDLIGIGINPVTIPREWDITHIPNLLHTFNDMDLARIVCPELSLIKTS